MKTGLDVTDSYGDTYDAGDGRIYKRNGKELLCQNVRCEMKHLHLNENSVREFARYR